MAYDYLFRNGKLWIRCIDGSLLQAFPFTAPDRRFTSVEDANKWLRECGLTDKVTDDPKLVREWIKFN